MFAGALTSRSLTPTDLTDAAQSGAESFSRLRLSAQVEAKATLTVTTREGDRVTLSANRVARAELTSIAYDRTGRPAGPNLSVRLASTQLHVAQAFDATIDGDLNEQERKDLDALLTNIDGVASAFFSGHLDEAVARALEVKDLGSLQGYRFEAGYSSRTSVEHETGANLAAAVPEGVVPEAEGPVPDTSSLADAVEEFFASFLKQREELTPLSLKALLPPPVSEAQAPEPVDVIVPQQAAVEAAGEEEEPPVQRPVEQGETSSDDPAPQEFDPAVVSDPAVVEPPKGEEPADQEPASGATGDRVEPERGGDSADSDPLAAFAQQIRRHIDASGLSSTRLGPYIPSLAHRLIEYRIGVLVSSLLP